MTCVNKHVQIRPRCHPNQAYSPTIIGDYKSPGWPVVWQPELLSKIASLCIWGIGLCIWIHHATMNWTYGLRKTHFKTKCYHFYLKNEVWMNAILRLKYGYLNLKNIQGSWKESSMYIYTTPGEEKWRHVEYFIEKAIRSNFKPP